ncbi:MAG: methylmalonyl-CoA mutase family protein [Candidatus Tectomicrobia bacterium]|nr:methylmalonyl-CoA mutase family protein [Candidatus Tectomicrobia bacterium]
MRADIGAARREWEEKVLRKTLERQPESREEFRTESQIPVERLYTPEHVADLDYVEDLGFPGREPFTRGVHPTMYRGRPWTMRQYAGYATAEESNRRYKYLLEQGGEGLSVAFDLPTQLGYDSDHPLAEGEVGRVGVAVDSLRDMEALFDGIPLDRVSTSMTINATACILMALYIAVAEGQGVPPEKLRGTVQNDILKEYIARGTYIYPPGPSLRIITDMFAYCGERLPRWNVISVSGYHMREAGCTAVQEVAFTLADAVAYVEAAVRAGLDADALGKNLSFFFAAHNNLLEEVAKFRAARRLWAKIMTERFGAKTDRARMLRFHTQTAGAALTAQQPLTNVVRVTLQALAAVLGGTQSLHTNSFDEALALPSEEAVRLALRTQQVIAHESGVADTADPLGGSYAVESLTREIEVRARDYIARIDEMGGMLRAIERGWVQREIHEAAYRHQRAVESEDRIVVGLNAYPEADGAAFPPKTLRIDPAVEAAQKARLAGLRKERDGGAVKRALGRVEEAARGTENLMPLILEAVRVYATVGEIADALRRVFREYEEATAL